MVKESKYGLKGCCQVCEHGRKDSEGVLIEIGCFGTKYPDRLCLKNLCGKCSNLFEYDDEKTMRIVNGEAHFDLEAECVFRGRLRYEDAKIRMQTGGERKPTKMKPL